ncbi:hypothetical protein J2X36_004750 [Methylobacterium sp. BE186]|uniref:hypothetical protein n=1 Tax=Methylobacterium sp. BE186 TaxID=2817715 RepID=UPI0028547CDF|nr:hypothetical protein [Methylobacterium sp. BE186]MDR7039972.1 hypothetical protein [Methylobacterium sp. BE186]
MKALLRDIKRRIERVEKDLGLHEQLFTVEARSESECNAKIAEIEATQFVGKNAIFVWLVDFSDNDAN